MTTNQHTRKLQKNETFIDHGKEDSKCPKPIFYTQQSAQRLKVNKKVMKREGYTQQFSQN